jgi:hypothetical protein
MPDQELPDQTSPGSELTRRVVVTGTGILVVSAALAACSSSGNSAQLATPTADEPHQRHPSGWRDGVRQSKGRGNPADTGNV